MTTEPEETKISREEEKLPFSLEELAILEDLFYIGHTESEKIVIYKDEKGKKITVTFRSLTPTEIRAIFEAADQFDSVGGRAVTEKIETLSRAITSINDMPLVLDPKEREEFHGKYNRDPTPLEQARHIFLNKVKSLHMINALYEAYEDFQSKITAHFEDVKKKLNNPDSSNST
jgi:hypothetical protein